MKKLILKYNQKFGNDKMPVIVKMTVELNCTIENAYSDEAQKMVTIEVSGDEKAIFEMNERLIRHASIDRKVG